MFDHSSALPSRAGLVREPVSSPSAREVETQLLAALKRVEAAQREAVSWFGEILDRRLYRRFGCSSIQQYARERLGFSTGRTSEFLRLWEALRKLPELKAAVESGNVGWTKACQVIKVATPETEAAWVEDAKAMNRPALRRKVDAARGAAKRRRRAPGQGEMPLVGAAHGVECRTQGTSEGGGALAVGDSGGRVSPDRGSCDAVVREVPVGMSLTFSPEQYARYEALVETARRAGVRGSREELLLAGLERIAGGGHSTRAGKKADAGALGSAVARAASRGVGCGADAVGRAGVDASATAAKGPDPHGNRGGASEPHYHVVIRVCETCGKATTPTTRGSLPVGAATLAAALCDSRVRRPGKQNRATIPPSMRREVLARDGHRCTSAGCRNTHFLHVHHVVPRGAGGSNDADNLVTLCGSCHRLVHKMERRGPECGTTHAGAGTAAGFQPAERRARDPETPLTPVTARRPGASRRR